MTVARNIHESDLRVSIPVLGAEEPAAAAKRSEKLPQHASQNVTAPPTCRRSAAMEFVIQTR